MTVVIDRSVDIELSLLAIGPDPVQQLTSADQSGNIVGGETSLTPSYAEIARIRMMAPVALSAAMNILEKLIQAGRINTDGFRRAIDAMIDENEQPNEDSDESAE